MTGVRVALDTSIAVLVLNEEPEAMARYHAEGPLALSVVAAGELLFGAVNSGLAARNLQRYERFISRALLIPIELDTARQYADLRLALSRRGKPIPENVIWIASACLQYGLTLVARDAHLSNCPGLIVEDWSVPASP